MYSNNFSTFAVNVIDWVNLGYFKNTLRKLSNFIFTRFIQNEKQNCKPTVTSKSESRDCMCDLIVTMLKLRTRNMVEIGRQSSQSKSRYLLRIIIRYEPKNDVCKHQM